MTLAIEYPGSKREVPAFGRLPMTIVTAIVSPSARLSPRMIAPAMPDLAEGSTA
jgi:hypothetical protein